MAAGVILAGGLTGVFLTPGTAYAADPIGTTTTIGGITQMSTGSGTTLTVPVSVTANGGTPTGTVYVSAGWAGGCSFTLGASSDSCPIADLPGGVYTLRAAYQGGPGFLPSFSGPCKVTIGQAPWFDVASPPSTATVGQSYSYTFHARGYPAPTYGLASGSPGWLQINPWDGTVWGTVPYGTSSFTYSVTATNSVGPPATTGPFTVWVKQGYIDIRTYLSCSSYVFTGQQGRCTLWVSNFGSARAPDVTAQIALPWQLRAVYCGYYYYSSCSISNNTAYQFLGTLYPGQTRALTVVFTAKTGYGLWGRHRGHPFTVSVFGYAASNGYGPFSGRRQSFSIAYVTVVPHGHWW
ncbi:MAG TPA: Ig-like domain repeat protein [Streptosporangiaceae bacterium]|nr:Ig-like domain repeat protein [Streptosporangiaceae bacterium]